MPDNGPQTRTPEQRLHGIVSEYIAARAAGHAPSPEEVLARHPDLADRLRPFLTGQGLDRAETLVPPDGDASPTRVKPGAPPTNRLTAADPTAPTLEPEGGPLPESVPFFRDFGDYELLGEVARGGMGVIFKAREKSLNRIVALKMILAGQLASPEQVRRFQVEAREAGNLDHPNIVPIYHVGEEHGQHYFTMKLIEGGNLLTRMPEFRRDLKAAAGLMAQVARAVYYAHQRGILHRDLKPANILLDEQGEPHVTDFGLAKHLEGDSGTQSGAIVGTPSYMAPEQAAARKDLTTAADVYGLGAILYELLTGRPPFQGDNPLETLVQVVDREPARPGSLDRRVDRDLETICLKCLEKEPGRRYASALRLAEDLERWLAGEPILARPSGRLERTAKWVKRRPAVAALLAVCAAAAVVLAVGGWWSSVALSDALDQAQARRREADEARRLAERQRRDALTAKALAEKRRQEAEANRKKADANAAEAELRGRLVREGFNKRLDQLDDFLIHVDGRLDKLDVEPTVRLEFLHDALRFSDGLLKEKKDDPGARRLAGRLYASYGYLWYQNHGYDTAQAALAKALELQKKLADDFPTKPEYQADLAMTYARRGRLLHDLHRLQPALASFGQAIKLQDDLVARDRANADYANKAAYFCFWRASLLEDAGKRDEALRGYRDALGRQEALAGRVGNRADLYQDAAMIADSLAALLAEKDRPAAVAVQEKALRARRQAFRLAPTSQRYAGELYEGYTDLAALLQKAHGHAGLARLADELLKDFPDNAGQIYNAACLMANAAGTARKSPRLGEPERKRLADGYGAQAVKLLLMAFQEGFRGRRHMDGDPDLDPLRGRGDYQALLADLDRRFPSPPLTPDKEYSALAAEYNRADRTYQAYARRARTPAERKRAQARRPDVERFAARFLELAEKHRDAPGAVDALVWVVEATTPAEGRRLPRGQTRLRARALARLEKDHLNKPELANVCQKLSESPALDCTKLLRAAGRQGRKEVQGMACYALAVTQARQAEQARELGRSDAEALQQAAEQQLEEVIKKYPAIACGQATLGEVAKAKLHELRHLTVGRPAQEIEGTDLEGKKFKLSDFRGKVVVLDFWVDWCGYCRQMYPHERQLVERLKGKPFALLGVNCDDSRSAGQRAAEKSGLNWRSWWAGSSPGEPITTQWQVNGWPTLYVLDGKGIIRYKFTQLVDRELDAAVDQLLREQAAERRGKK